MIRFALLVVCTAISTIPIGIYLAIKTSRKGEHRNAQA